MKPNKAHENEIRHAISEITLLRKRLYSLSETNTDAQIDEILAEIPDDALRALEGDTDALQRVRDGLTDIADDSLTNHFERLYESLRDRDVIISVKPKPKYKANWQPRETEPVVDKPKQEMRA